MSEIRLLKAHRRVSVRRHDTNHRFGFCRHFCSREARCHRYRKTGQWRSLPSKPGKSGISASVLAQTDGTREAVKFGQDSLGGLRISHS